MFLFDLERSALTNALPSTPTPADSIRPRAKITSTAGHAADADGTSAVVPGSTVGAMQCGDGEHHRRSDHQTATAPTANLKINSHSADPNCNVCYELVNLLLGAKPVRPRSRPPD